MSSIWIQMCKFKYLDVTLERMFFRNHYIFLDKNVSFNLLLADVFVHQNIQFCKENWISTLYVLVEWMDFHMQTFLDKSDAHFLCITVDPCTVCLKSSVLVTSLNLLFSFRSSLVHATNLTRKETVSAARNRYGEKVSSSRK